MSTYHVTAQDTLVLNNLSGAVSLAFNNNTDILNGQLDIESKHQHSKEVMSAGLPQVKADGKLIDNTELPVNIFPVTGAMSKLFAVPAGSVLALRLGMQNNINGGVQAHQLLYDQSFFINLKTARSTGQLSEMSLTKIKEDLALQLATTYYNELLCNRQIEFLRKQLDSYKNLFQVAEVQFQNGTCKKTDLDRIIVNRTNLESSLQDYESLDQQQLSDMKLLMGISIEKELVIKDSISDKSIFAESGSVDIHNRIDWLILQKQGEIQEYDIMQKKAGYLPVLAFNAIYNKDYWGMNYANLYSGSSWYSSSYLNLTLDVPIFEGFKKKSQIAQSTISLNEIHNRQALLSSTFNKEISDARNKLINSLVRLESQNKNLKLANDVYQSTILEYKEGTANLSDLLNSENSLLESQTQFMSAIADKLLAELSLQKAKGVLLQSIDTSLSK